MARVATKLLRARRLLLMALAQNPDCRAAWDLLAGPTDWEKAKRGERQDNEPFVDPKDPILPNMRQAGMLLTAEAGLLADLAGGKDALAELRAQTCPAESAESKTNDGLADASAWSRDACPDRPAAAPDEIRGEPFDVTDSLRVDSSALPHSLTPAEPPESSAPGSPGEGDHPPGGGGGKAKRRNKK